MYYLIGFSLILGYLLLILKTTLSIGQEIYFYSWLISKHLILYKDTWYNHGFFLFLLLSFLPFHKSILSFKIFLVVIQLVNLSLVLLIVKKYKSVLGFLAAGVFFITITYYVAENSLWDEVFLTTVTLSIFYILGLVKKYHWIIGVLVGFMFFIKPTAIVFLIPIVFFTKNKSILFSFFTTIFAGALYLLLTHSFFAFINDVIIYNMHYGKYFIKESNNMSVQYFFVIIYLLAVALVTASVLGKNFRKSLPELSFFLAGYIFMVPTPDFIHSVPFVSFFTIYAISVITYSQKYVKYLLIVFFLIFYFGYLYKKAKYDYVYQLPKRTDYIQGQTDRTMAKLVNDVDTIGVPIKNLYIFGYQLQVYYFLDKVPITRFLPLAPWVTDYYPNIESEIISDIRDKDVTLIIIPEPVPDSFVRLHTLNRYIYSHYYRVKVSGIYEIYERK